MASKTTQKQGGGKGPGPLPALFTDAEAAAEPFREMRRAGGLACPKCHRKNVTRYCKSRDIIRRYVCKNCHETFNDKTGTLLRYRSIGMGVRMYPCRPLNGISINCISESINRTYAHCMVRRMMARLSNMQEKALSGTCETAEMYVKAVSKGVPLETTCEDRTLSRYRAIPRGPGRGTFEKDTPMATVYRRRAAKDERDWTIFDVPLDKKIVEMVQKSMQRTPWYHDRRTWRAQETRSRI